MPSTAEIVAAAEAIKATMQNMYGWKLIDEDDLNQIARNALQAAKNIRNQQQPK